MIWPGILGAVLGVLNTIWAIYRYFADQTFAKWSFSFDPNDRDAQGNATHVQITNAGNATA